MALKTGFVQGYIVAEDRNLWFNMFGYTVLVTIEFVHPIGSAEVLRWAEVHLKPRTSLSCYHNRKGCTGTRIPSQVARELVLLSEESNKLREKASTKARGFMKSLGIE